MSDRLEEFVKQHREQFDVHEPDPSVWLKIQPERIELKQESRSMRWLRVAAALAIIFAGFAAGIHFLSGGRTQQDLYSSEMYQQIRETEAYYGQLVSERYREVEGYLASDPAAREMLDADMEELDQVYDELKEDLNDNASNPEVIEAMILNYRVKLEILEDLLDQLKAKENQDEEDDSHAL
jgi:predicted CopG family antitoxin